MDSITGLLSGDHGRCDDLFFQTESHVSKGQWEQAIGTFEQFKTALERHLTMEEEILFPALEQAMGGSFGPTVVMRGEHQQMRQIVSHLDAAINARDADEALGNSETLNIMVQQHNLKEESMLYLMADKALASRKAEIITAMA